MGSQSSKTVVNPRQKHIEGLIKYYKKKKKDKLNCHILGKFVAVDVTKLTCDLVEKEKQLFESYQGEQYCRLLTEELSLLQQDFNQLKEFFADRPDICKQIDGHWMELGLVLRLIALQRG